MGTALVDAKNLHFMLQCLGERERVYVEARVLGSTPVAAARAAGYEDATTMARRHESDDRIRGAMEYTLRSKIHEQRFTREDVLSMFMEAYRMAATSTEMTAATREIAKMEGYYAPKRLELSNADREQMARLSDSDLADMAAIEGEFVELKDDD